MLLSYLSNSPRSGRLQQPTALSLVLPAKTGSGPEQASLVALQAAQKRSAPLHSQPQGRLGGKEERKVLQHQSTPSGPGAWGCTA